MNFLKGEEEEKQEKLKQQGLGKLFLLPRALFHFCPSLINKPADTPALVGLHIVIVLESVGFITGSSL